MIYGDEYKAWLCYPKFSLETDEDKQNFEDWLRFIKNIKIKGKEPLNSNIMKSFKQRLSKIFSYNEININFIDSKTYNDNENNIKGWEVEEEAFSIEAYKDEYLIDISSYKGLINALFKILTTAASSSSIKSLIGKHTPKNAIRMLNHWDNIDGNIERGYAGKSIFFRNGELIFKENDLKRIEDYAKLIASAGYNAIAINNVNVHKKETELILPKNFARLSSIANIFRKWGIHLFLSINYAAQMELGEIDTADPLNERVKQWWSDKAADLWKKIPDFGGFLVKADSEGRPGPFTYGRNQADGANMLAQAVEPHDGLILWRCFVYNCQQDWRDRSTDRAKAAYDYFKPLDGQFKENVLLQIKNGPMDFQVREPVSPLFSALKHTNVLFEAQITQEYTGQQRHLCGLLPMWKEILDFKTGANKEESPIKEIACGKVFNRNIGGMTAVANIGDDKNWTGHLLAQSNLFGYGQLCWNPNLSTEEILSKWIKLTFGVNKKIEKTILSMLEKSWEIYESYTAPLGVGWMVKPDVHYGPDVDGYEYSRWGTYHFADRNGIGVDRTVATGTGYTSQYCNPWNSIYENIETCPDNLILFFHHEKWSHLLKSGKTVIQHIYDSHFTGAQKAEELLMKWESLKNILDEDRYNSVLKRLMHQVEHSKEWRDQINTYCFRKSGIKDEQNRKIYD